MGGLLGGMAGILLSYYIHPLAIPFGVLVGVVLGWWHTEIAQSVVTHYHHARAVTGGVVQVADEAVAWLGRMCGLPLTFVRLLRWLIAKAVVGTVVWLAKVVVWCVTAPRRLHQFNSAHPMNYARSIELTVYFAWLVFGTAFGAWLFHGLPLGKGAVADGGEVILGGLLGIFVAVFGATVPIIRDESDIAEMRSYYRQWEVISRYGALGLLAYTVLRNARYSLGFAVFVTILFGWGAPMAMLFFLGVFPTFAVLGIFRGFYLAAQRAGHWPCFGVTLLVTGLSWLYFHDTFTNDAVVWSVALVTGVASGAATELVRRPLLAFYGDTAIGRWLSRSMEDVMGDSDSEIGIDNGTGYFGLAVWMTAFWVSQSPIARLLRTLCFGTPVYRPVRIG